MRIEKAIAWSLAIHLLLTGAYAVNLGIKRCSRTDAPDAVFAELVPPAPDTAHRSPERLAEAREAAASPDTPAEATPDAFVPSGAPEATPAAEGGMAALPSDPMPEPAAAEPQPQPAPPPPASPEQPPAEATATAAAEPGRDAAPDNVATAAAPFHAPDHGALERARLHHAAMVSTAAFYRFVPGELNRFVNDVLANGAIMSQGDALVHMDVTPSGQVGRAHLQANSQALLNRLERVDWTAALPARPLAACNAIHLRITVVGNDIRVNVEML